MASSGGPKSAGEKPSNRKRSNAKSQPVHETVDLLQDLPTPPNKQAKEDFHVQFEQRPSMGFNKPLPHDTSGGLGQNQVLSQQGLHQMYLQSSPDNRLPGQNAMGFNSVFTPAASLQNSGFLPGQSQYPSPFSHQIGGIASHVGCESFNINSAHQPPYSGQSGGMLNNSTNNFTLKWLAGTRVTRCYGCRGDIQNPPLDAPDDLIIVYKGHSSLS